MSAESTTCSPVNVCAQPFIDAEEKVNKVPGVSQIHQAFSTKER